MADVPHDPSGTSTQCPICKVTWPCPERQRQRKEASRIRATLRDAMMQPRSDITITIGTHTVEARRWEDPLGWSFDLGYGEHGLMAVRISPERGRVESTNATEEWTELVLT